jgi:hypothetical protein
LLLALAQPACGDSSSAKDDDESDAGSGGSGTGGAGTGGAGTGGTGGGTGGNAGSAGDSGEGNSAAEGGTGATGGTGDRGGSSGSSGSGGTGGTSGGGTNMPGVGITPEGGEILDESGDVVGDGPEWLQLLSSHYDVHVENPLQMHWLGLVKNIGPEIVCPTALNPTFYDERGTELLSFIGGLVYAPLYVRAGEDTPRTCVAPGELAMAVAFDFADRPVELEQVAEVGYSVTGRTYSDLSPRDWIELSDVTLENNAVGGTVTTGDDELSSWNLNVFGTVESDVGRVPLGLQFASKGELSTTIAPGDVDSFEAPPFHAPVTDFQVFYTVQLP